MQQILAICLRDPQYISDKIGGLIPEADRVTKYLTLNQWLNLSAPEACALLLAAFVAFGLVATVMTNSDSAGGSDDRFARARLPATPVLSDGCDLAGAIPECKKVMREMATRIALKSPSLFKYVPWGN